jgi:hypothetical protein
MAMSRNQRDERSEKPWERMIQERQEHLEAVLDALTQKSADVELSPAMKRDVAVATVNLHRMVSKYTDEGVLDDGDLPDISPIRERLGQTTRIQQQSAGLRRGATAAEVPAIDELEFDYLEGVANQTEQAAKQLGFWASMSASPSGGSRLPNPNNLTAEPPALDGDSSSVDGDAAEFEQSHFFRSLYQDVEGDRGGGAIVIVDAEDARTGIGKTGAACGMAEFVSWYFGYDIQDSDGVLSGQEYLDLFETHPNEEQVSACVWDEAVGAGSGDARRAMAQENVDLGRAWQLMRDRKVITFVTLPDWGDLDSRLQKLADYRVWCRRDIGSMQAYEIGTTFEGGDIRTRGLGPGEGAEPIAFPDVTEDSSLYEAIKQKKNKVQESDSLSADELREEESDESSGTDEPETDLQKIADEVVADVDEYTSVHGGNGTKYIDRDEIDLEYDLSRRQLRKVKKLVEKEVGEL